MAPDAERPIPRHDRAAPADSASAPARCPAPGDCAAAEDLLPLVYEQLRRAAQQQLASDGAGQSLGATALVHEAYLKLAGPRELPWAGRAHFYAAAAEAMRRILVDRARARGADARARGHWKQARDLAQLDTCGDCDGILAFDDALVRLEAVDSDAAQVVRLRFFAGLSVEETAQALGVSPRTVDREWAFARAWLLEAIGPLAQRQSRSRNTEP